MVNAMLLEAAELIRDLGYQEYFAQVRDGKLLSFEELLKSLNIKLPEAKPDFLDNFNKAAFEHLRQVRSGAKPKKTMSINRLGEIRGAKSRWRHRGDRPHSRPWLAAINQQAGGVEIVDREGTPMGNSLKFSKLRRSGGSSEKEDL